MTQLFTGFADSCSHLFGLPTWYEYIHPKGNCSLVQIHSLSDIWLIVAAVIEILLRVAALVAVGIMIYGGFAYTTSQGEPEKTSRARTTLINGAIGLVIALLSATLVNFVARSVH